jgi:ribose transport system substrate-binding protein
LGCRRPAAPLHRRIQNPVGIGQQCVVAAVKAIKGISQPTTIDTGFYWYDKTNITDPKIAVDLYQ